MFQHLVETVGIMQLTSVTKIFSQGDNHGIDKTFSSHGAIYGKVAEFNTDVFILSRTMKL